MIAANMTGLGIFQGLTRTDRIEAATKRALEAEAERLADAIRDAAPEHDGSLRASVRVEPGERPMSIMVKAGGTPDNTKTNTEGAQFDEALMQEYGTSRIAAQPFFYPTVERMREEIKDNIDSAMEGATGE